MGQSFLRLTVKFLFCAMLRYVVPCVVVNMFYTHSAVGRRYLVRSPRFTPESVFYTQSVMLNQSAFYTSVRFLYPVRCSQSVVRNPQSTVRSPQALFYSDRVKPQRPKAPITMMRGNTSGGKPEGYSLCKSLIIIQCVRCHAIKNEIKNHSVD